MLIKRGKLLQINNKEKAQVVTAQLEELITANTDAIQRPKIAYITFLNLEAQVEAIKQFNKSYERNNGDEFEGHIFLERCGSPHSIEWENINITITYRLLAGFIYVLILSIYLYACILLI
jgi:hypothetical protein